MSKKNRKQKIYGSYDSLKKENQYLRNKLNTLPTEQESLTGYGNYLIKLFNDLPFEVILLEASGEGESFHLLDLNRKAENVLKSHRTELLGKSFEAVCNALSSEKIQQTLRNVLTNGKKSTLAKQYFIGSKPKDLEITKISDTQVAISAYEPVKSHHHKNLFTNHEAEVLQHDISSDHSSSGEKGQKGLLKTIEEDKASNLHFSEEQEKYRNLMNQSPTAILELDKKGRIVEYNRKADKIFSLGLITIPMIDKVPIFKSSKIPNKFSECLNTETIVHGEDNIRIAELQLSLKYHFSPLKNNRNQVYGIMGVFDDCTQISAMQNMLSKNEQHYKDLLKLLPEVVFEADVQGNLLFTNDKAFDIFEYSGEDIKKGINIFECIHEKDRERARQNMSSVMASQRSQGNAYTAVTKSGKKIPVLIYSSSIVKNNEAAGVRGLVVNISQLRETESALETSEENFRQLAENITDGFWLSNMENRIIYSNPACKLIAERNLPQISPYPNIFYNWIHPEDREKVKYEISLNEEHPEVEHVYEHRLITPHEKEKWLWIRISPVFNEKKQLYRRAGIVSDITQQKTLIRELVRAKERAEESDRMKSSFLANMSHEIRTPMNGILGFAQMLKSPDSTDAEKDEYLSIIKNNGTQLLNLINDILDIARIEAGQLMLNKNLFDLNKFMQSIYHNYKKQYEKNLNRIDFRLIPGDREQNIQLYSDPSRIQQILSNLIVNAFKYTTKGSIQFGYQTGYVVNKIRYIKFFVADTGIGLDKGDLDRIFDRFKQIINNEGKKEGTGLGLTISKNLVHLLKGRIWVDSEKGKGSTFYFIIPDQREITEEKAADKEKVKIGYDKKTKTILVVEDDIINQKYLQKLLDNQNINIIVTKTGEKAIEIVKSNPSINLILMDIRLPGMNGYETTRAIKKINSQIPIIAQTAYAMLDEHNKSLAMGCDDYISKPIDQNILFEKLNDYLYTNKNL